MFHNIPLSVPYNIFGTHPGRLGPTEDQYKRPCPLCTNTEKEQENNSTLSVSYVN